MKATDAFEKLEAARDLARRERAAGRTQAYRDAMKLVYAREAELEEIIASVLSK